MCLLTNGCSSLGYGIIAANNAAQIYERVKPVKVEADFCDSFNDILPIYLDGDLTGLTDGDITTIRTVNKIYEELCDGS